MAERCEKTTTGQHEVRVTSNSVTRRGEMRVVKVCARCGKRRVTTEPTWRQGRLW